MAVMTSVPFLNSESPEYNRSHSVATAVARWIVSTYEGSNDRRWEYFFRSSAAPSTLNLVTTVRHERPTSIDEAARMADRDVSTVQEQLNSPQITWRSLLRQ